MGRKLSESERLYRKLKKQAQKANKRLRDLQREYQNETWAEKNLYSKIGAKGTTPTGLIKVRKRMSEAVLRKQLKATEAFLKDKRSTVKGLEKVKKDLEESISKELQTDTRYNLTVEEADNLVQLFKEETFNELTKYIPPSDLWAYIREAKEQGIHSKKKFVDLFRKHFIFSENKGIVKTLEQFYTTNY